MTFRSDKLRRAARGNPCVRCGAPNSVGAHYTGARRQAYGGGFGIKVSDLYLADLCDRCHKEMDTLLRDKGRKWEHSEAFQHYILLTIARRVQDGVLVVT